MMEIVFPRYQWGQRVCASSDLFNDGSYPDSPPDAVLVCTGESGEIVQVGTHSESNKAVYLVEFSANRVVGCFEHEIHPLA